MAKENKQSLLYKLKSLYTKLFLVTLHNRIVSYHAIPHTNLHHEISGSLYKLIDEIVNEVSNTYSPLDYKHLKFLNDEKGLSPTSTHLQIHTTTMVSMTLNGLSLYLQKQNVMENDPRMSERLKRCVWEHVHSAHRFARFGDAKTAKLHADIACNAMKSLSQYMPADDYHDFSTEFYTQLASDIEQDTLTSAGKS